MSNELVIRQANRADRRTLLAFHRALYVDHRNAIMKPELADFYAYRDLDAALAQDVDAILGSGRSVALIAEVGARPVGYITGHLEEDERRVLPRKGVIEDWYVEGASRGRGVGKQLVAVIEQVFVEAGCDVLESMTWPFNQSARQAHLRLGFSEIEIKFRKRLAPRD